MITTDPTDPAFWGPMDVSDDDTEAEDEHTYEIVRFYADRDEPSRVLETGLTLAEAQEHCNDPETSSSTATSPDEPGMWFDGFREE